MPGPTVGYAEIKVDFDGSRLPTQAAALSKAAGDKMGKGSVDAFNKEFSAGLNEWSRDLTKQMVKGGKLGTKAFTDQVKGSLKRELDRISQLIADGVATKKGFARLAKEVGGSDEAVKQLNESLQTLVDTGELTEKNVNRMSRGINKWAKELKDSELAAAADQAAQKAAAAAAKQAAADRIDAADAVRLANQKVREENERLSRVLQDVNLHLANQKNWDVLVKNTRDSAGATRQLVDQMDELRRLGKISEAQYAVLANRVREFSSGIDASNAGLGRHNVFLKAASIAADKVSVSYRRMDSTVRLVIGLIVSAASDIAALGSAAGAGLLSIAAAFTQVVVGGIGVGTVFNRLNKDLDELVPSMRSVASEWQAFQDTFGQAADIIASSAFAQMGTTFEKLALTMQGLAPAFSKLGDAIGQAFDLFADTFRVGQAGFVELNKLIENSADTFLDLSEFMATFTTALLRGFNKANPLVEDLVGWMQRLADQFDDFTQSEDFEQWVENARDVFSSLAGVVDSVFRAMNDLVDQDAIGRLTAMLDDLARAIPGIFEGLDVISTLDPLGLLVDTLADLLEAISPLFDPLDQLAGALNAIITSGIDAIIPVIAGLATVLGGLLDAIPPAVLVGLVTAILGFKAVGSIVPSLQRASTAIYDFGLNLVTMPDKVGKLKALGKGLGLAALFSGVANAMANANKEATLTVDKLAEVDAAFSSGRGGAQSFFELFGDGVYAVDQARNALDGWSGSIGATSGFEQDFANAIDGLTFGITHFGDALNEEQATFSAWGRNLAEVADTDIGLATKKFDELVQGFGGGDDVIKQLLETMPEYEAKLRELASATGETLTDQELYNLAVGDSILPMTDAARAAETNAEALAEMQGKAVDASGEISALADQIRGFGSATLTTRDAEREFQAAIDDLTASVAENGASLEITEAAGRANQAALDDIAQSALAFAGATLEQTGSQEAATAALATGREELIKAYEQFGFTREQAEAYADQLGLIPENIGTASDFTKDPEAQSYKDTVDRIPERVDSVAVFTVVGYDQLMAAQAAIRVLQQGAHVATSGQGGLTFASGGLLTRPTRVLAGEAGPEAIVPLRRPLSQVDPSVRGLSAIAQGKGGMASGGVVGSGKTVIVESGAITVVTAASDGRNVAGALLDRIVANLPS